MLWNSIYEFYVKNIFGGFLLENDSYVGYGARFSIYDYTGGELYNSLSPHFTLFGVNITLGNYLSYIATLITIIIILVLCSLFVYKIIKLIGGLIR